MFDNPSTPGHRYRVSLGSLRTPMHPKETYSTLFLHVSSAQGHENHKQVLALMDHNCFSTHRKQQHPEDGEEVEVEPEEEQHARDLRQRAPQTVNRLLHQHRVLQQEEGPQHPPQPDPLKRRRSAISRYSSTNHQGFELFMVINPLRFLIYQD